MSLASHVLSPYSAQTTVCPQSSVALWTGTFPEFLYYSLMLIPTIVYQIGFRIALYTSNLLSSESCYFRPVTQCSLRSLRSSCFLSVSMCLRQVSFRSRCLPKYFASSVWVNCLSFSWREGHVFF